VKRSQVQDWLSRYIAAWRSNERADITSLFSSDAQYRYHPYDDAIVGAEAIADAWLEDPDDPSTWEATYDAVAVDGETAVAVGLSRYRGTEDRPAREYHNCFVLRFDDAGRCRELTEWFMQTPSDQG
jgi:ketosteroid isomerase-like protein